MGVKTGSAPNSWTILNTPPVVKNFRGDELFALWHFEQSLQSDLAPSGTDGRRVNGYKTRHPDW